MLNLNYLKTQRLSRNLTHEQMSLRLGFKSSMAYIYLETGKRKISLERFIQIVEVLDLDLSSAIKGVAAVHTSSIEGGEENV